MLNMAATPLPGQAGTRRIGYARVSTADQDLAVATGQQLGFQSRGFKGAYLSGQENRIQQFHNGIDRYIAEGKAQKNR